MRAEASGALIPLTYRIATREIYVGQIGVPKREIYVEPLQIPVPAREPVTRETPQETPAPQPIGVPA
jgi:hypothetical protein